MDHPHLRIPRSAAATLLVACVLALAACSNSGSRAIVASTTTTTAPGPDLPDRPALLQPPPGFRIPDTRNVVVKPVTGKPGAQPGGGGVAVRGGHSMVTGVVNGPDGAVVGATVLIERFVGSDSGSITVVSDGAGQFSVGSLWGGRYRVRAWLAPSLTTTDAATGFVADGDRLSVAVGVERHDAVTLQVASGVSVQTVGVSAPVNGLLVRESVDGDGIVHTVGVGGVAVTLTSSAPLVIAAPNPAITGPDGRVQWNVTCAAVGPVKVDASAATPPATASAGLPDCADPVPTTVPGPP